jgi:type 2 lantibiotic biosynthesis protein LanM
MANKFGGCGEVKMTVRANRNQQHLYAALTLRERLTYAHASDAATSLSKAAEVVGRWKAQPPFSSRDNFETRLQQDGLTEDGLLRVLTDSAQMAERCAGNPPAWLRDLNELYSSDDSEDGLEFQNRSGVDNFAYVVSPLMRDARRRLLESLRDLPEDGLIDPSLVESLFLPSLFAVLRRPLRGVMVLELNVARLRGTLKGESPQERFRHFCETLRDPEARRSLLREYPVLFRALHTKANAWVNNSVELLSRLHKDFGLISREFSEGNELGSITGIAMGLGDEHRGGKSVATIQFSSGLKLVYKPRSLAVDLHFHELLRWLQQAGFDLPLHVPKIADRESYGWSEFVEHAGCSRREEVERYYRRLGAYLAVFYALRAADMHNENIIAHGEYPVPVDLETLFHPDVEVQDDPAVQVANSSVMRVLLLPTALGSKTMEPIDISALAASDDQLYPAGSFGMVEAEGTDEMRLAYDRPMPMAASQSRPKLLEQGVNVQEFLPEFEMGFEQVYRLLESHRDELLSPNGLLDRFADDEVRFVARPTRLYAALLDRSYHPDSLRDAIEREQLFDSLWRHASDLPVYRKLIPAERTDLHNGDVPVFGSHPGSQGLWTSHGELIPDIFERPALERVRAGVARLGSEDLARQIYFIRLSINSVGKRAPTVRRTPKAPTCSRDPLDLARVAGDFLCEQVYESDRYANWIGLNLIGSREVAWSLESLAPDFYEGTIGIAFFLGYLGVLAGEGRYSEVANKCIDLARALLERRRRMGLPTRSVGAFTGEGGTIYALTHLAVLWRGYALLDEANTLACELEPFIENDSMLDVVGGSAGFIAVLKALNTVRPDDRLLPIAIRCGEKLLREQKPQSIGSAWKTRTESTAPLTGFSHGAAGMAWALLKLAEWSGEKRFRLGAESAIRYERGTFLAAQSNWPDYRAGLERNDASVAWCHGAPGIGLARLDSSLALEDLKAREEIRVALTRTAESSFGRDYCLCHGDFGNLDILLTAVERTDRCWWSEHGERLFRETLARIEEDGVLRAEWCAANPLGLMTGLAGIGYGLLRIAYPDKVPSVLTLQAPPKSGPLG